ncbi:AAA family ATPase [Ideonella sp. A 288]|uniref:ATP-binding protein n=1 Tax=Ideonella sp. A 288 TaxID=1962181 RepID=UPI000B4B80BD|nr:AAA family ATPase [Ideonella sp. A 288]
MLAAPMPPPTLALHLSGDPQVVAGHGVAQPLGTVDALLLGWLAVCGPTGRDRLASLLWPDSPADAARTALRQRLFRLRKQFGEDPVAGTRQLSLAPGVAHDLDEATTLLGNLQLPAGTELAQWLDDERARRRELARSRLLQRIDALEQAADLPAALPLARELIALDPLREDAHQRLMRLLYLGGDRAGALKAFDDCEQRLKHDLGARPSPETLALLATIEAAAREAAPGGAARRTLPAALMRPPRLVGRGAELARLQRVLSDGGRALVLGEAGLGKSRLLQAAAAASNPPWMAAGRPGDALVPYATLGRALRALQALRPQALASVPAGHLAPVLPELVPAQPEPVTVRRDTMVAALSTVARDALAGLGGIVLDDLHFADDATLQLLPELVAAAGPGAWLMALRPPAEGTPCASLLAALGTAAPWETLALAPLDDAALAEMVDSLQLPGVQGRRLAALLRARSGGNPLFALETLKLAWTEGHALDSGDLPRPRNVGQLIDSALSELSPRALLLARVAAIAGVDFSIDLAEQVLRQGALELADPWAELESRQVLRGTAFGHDLMHEAVLAGIPEVLARHAHGQVAGWLEQHQGEPARIAAHWEAAGQRERALPGLRAAAQRAHAALREPERVAFLLRGADIAEAAGRGDEAFELIAQAAEAHMNTIRDAAGLPLLDRLDGLSTSPHQRARAAGHRAWYLTTLADWDGAIEAGRRALACCGEVDDAELCASISQRLGTALAMAGRFDEALPQLRAAEPWVDAHVGSDTAAEFLGNLAAVLDNLGHAHEAEAYHLRVIDATRAMGDQSFMATARANLAVSRLQVGDVAGARAQLTLAQQVVAGYELRGASAGFVAALQAQAERAAGDYPAALQWCDTAERLISAAGPAWLPVVHMHRAQVLLDLAQAARAQQALARCDAAALPPRLRARHGLLTGRLRLALQQGARREFDAALALAPRPGWPELRLTLRIERAGALDLGEAVAELVQVAEEALALGLSGVVLAARLRLAAMAPLFGLGGAPAETLAAAEEALATDPGIEPNGLYRAERWAGPAWALHCGGQAARATALAQDGLAWVDACAERLPEAWREAFLQRHPVNQALRHLATLPMATVAPPAQGPAAPGATVPGSSASPPGA